VSLQPGSPSRRRRWTRGYPPLILLALAVLAVVIVLPSSLNLPQSNPTTVLEYAPVPPQDKNSPPLQGNMSNLGLGTSHTLALPAAPPPPPPATNLIQGIGGRPNQKHCVGSPPRQSEDPSSPPCVPFFQGENFGSTYQGVTRQEITVLVYFDAGATGLVGQLETSPPPGTYVDIDKPRLPNCPPDQGSGYTDPNQCDQVWVRVLKSFSHYFNDRFQTYNRHVHYWAYFTSGSNTSAAQRRGDAVANVERLHPFAVLDEATFGGFNEEYDTAMNQLHVLTFSSSQGSLPNSYYRTNAPLSWGFYPDVEHWAALYSTYVCKKVAPYPVSHYGNPPGAGPPNGAKRKYGLWYTVDPGAPQFTTFAQLVKTQLRTQCGITGVDATYSRDGYAADSGDTGTEGAQGAAKFQGAGVTTVLYLGGTETRFSDSADAVRYYPEIVVAGNLANDNNFIGSVQNQNVWQNASASIYRVRINRLQDAPGYRAYKEGDPSGDDSAGVVARDEYRDNFMLFQGIQIAGPRLSPESVDQGLHAIQPQLSTSPYAPALYFDGGDYTMMKDAMQGWWDPQGHPFNPTGGAQVPGCWRLGVQGKRYTAGHWPAGDDAFRDRNDPCDGGGGSIRTR
jgi:hypothetical protein